MVLVNEQVDKISADDYFLKSSEFAMWLKEDRGVYFTDLSSKETHELFEPFVEKWNAGRLHPKYYDGIQQAPRTNHNWAIKNAPSGSAIDGTISHGFWTRVNAPDCKQGFQKCKIERECKMKT